MPGNAGRLSGDRSHESCVPATGVLRWIDEVAESFESRIEELVNERVEKRLKELGHA